RALQPDMQRTDRRRVQAMPRHVGVTSLHPEVDMRPQNAQLAGAVTLREEPRADEAGELRKRHPFPRHLEFTFALPFRGGDRRGERSLTPPALQAQARPIMRSEERRVGKETRA